MMIVDSGNHSAEELILKTVVVLLGTAFVAVFVIWVGDLLKRRRQGK